MFNDKTLYLLKVDETAGKINFIPQFTLTKTHHWTKIVFQLRKPRVYIPVEDILFQKLNNFRSRVNAHRLLQRRKQIIDEDREACDVVHVWVSDDDVAHVIPLLFGKSHRDAAGIDGHARIDEETRKTLFEGCMPVGVECAR